jgi:hypothetical protein
MTAQTALSPAHSTSVAGPVDYMLKRWKRFARSIGDGRICLSNNDAARKLDCADLAAPFARAEPQWT